MSNFVHVAFLDANTKANGAAFLREVVAAFPYRLHTVLTDNRSPAGDRSASCKDRRQETAEAAWPLPTRPVNRGRYPEIEAFFGGHIFDVRVRRARHRASPHQALPPPPQTPACGPGRRRIDGLLATPGRMVRLNG